MQDDDSDDGSGHRPAAYREDAPSRNMASFELPNPDDDDDHWFKKTAPIFDRLGRPKNSNGYAWRSDDDLGDLTDDDRTYRDHIGRAMWEANITAKQAARLERAHVEHVKTLRDAASAKGRDANKLARAELTKEFGAQAASRIQKANTLFKEHGGREAGKLAGLILSDGTPLSANAAFVKFLANLADVTPAKKGGPTDAAEEIQRIRRQAERDGLDPTSPRYPNEQLQKLYERVHGSNELETDGSDSGVGRRRR